MLLSILIPTLPSRRESCAALKQNIRDQLNAMGLRESVEILEDSRQLPITTGEKRNNLLSLARGLYVWQVDDDDELLPDAFARLIPAMLAGADVIGINGYMTTDGTNRVDWEIRIGHPYSCIQKNGKDYYLRHPNHITPMRRELAAQVRFEHITQQEDYRWAMALKEAGLLKTQEIVDYPIYHYKYRTTKADS